MSSKGSKGTYSTYFFNSLAPEGCERTRTEEQLVLEELGCPHKYYAEGSQPEAGKTYRLVPRNGRYEFELICKWCGLATYIAPMDYPN